MRPRYSGIILALMVACGFGFAPNRSGATEAGPALGQLLDLARKELPGVSAEDLDRWSERGLMHELEGKGLLVEQMPEPESGSCIAASRVFDGRFALVRMSHVGSNAAGDFQKAFDAIKKTNQLQGLVLDLRFVNGNDYAGAANVADLFLNKARTIFDVGGGEFRSHEKSEALDLPCVVLINQGTSVAAEALAAALRESREALLIGDATAGRARYWRPFTLTSGQRISLAGEAVKLASGQEIPGTGVAPDIVVKVSPELERDYIENPYYDPDPRATARAITRNRPNEAQLVREHNGSGTNESGYPTASGPAKPVSPQVRDPVLVRGLDLLKGLAVVRAGQPS